MFQDESEYIFMGGAYFFLEESIFIDDMFIYLKFGFIEWSIFSLPECTSIFGWIFGWFFFFAVAFFDGETIILWVKLSFDYILEIRVTYKDGANFYGSSITFLRYFGGILFMCSAKFYRWSIFLVLELFYASAVARGIIFSGSPVCPFHF